MPTPIRTLDDWKEAQGLTPEQELANALVVPSDASDDELRGAARTISRLHARIDDPDGRRYNGAKGYKEPLPPRQYHTLMVDMFKRGTEAIKTSAKKEWDALPEDEEARYQFATGKQGGFEKNVKVPLGNLASSMFAIREQDLPEDVTDQDRELVRKMTRRYLEQPGKQAKASDYPDTVYEGPEAPTQEGFSPPTPEEEARLDKLRERVNKRRVIAQYDAKMLAENVAYHWMTVRDEVSEPARKMVESYFLRGIDAKEVWQTGQNTAGDMARKVFSGLPSAHSVPGFNDAFVEQFHALPLKDKQVVSMFIHAGRQTSDDNWLQSASRQFWNMAVDLPIKAREKLLFDGVRRQFMTDAEWNKTMQTRALLMEAVAYKPDDFGEFGNAMVGVAATLPYMGYAAVPYVGAAIVAGQAMHDFEARVAAEGGDVSSTKFRAMNLLTAAAYVAVEKAQLKGITKVPDPLLTRIAYLKTLKSASNFLRVAWDFSKESSKEIGEETLQMTLESALVATGVGSDVARSVAEESIQEARNVVGTMGLLTAGGMAWKGINLRVNPRLKLDEMVSAAYRKHRILAGLANPGDKDTNEDRDALAELREIWYKAGSEKNAAQVYMDRLGLPEQMADSFAYMFRAERSAIMGSPTLDEDRKQALLKYDERKEALQMARRLAPDAEITERENGDFTITRTMKGVRHTVDVKFTLDGTLDLHDPDPKSTGNASIVNAINEARRVKGEDAPITAEGWVAMTPQGRQEMSQRYALAKEGWFNKLNVEHGVTEAGLKVLKGEITINRAAHPGVIFHEYFHGFTRMLKDAGMLQPADIAKLREEFGDPKTADEEFDEEAAANAFREYAARKTSPPANSALAHIWNALTSFVNAITRKKAVKTASQDILTAREAMFEQVRAGNFTGVAAYTAASTHAARKAAQEREARTKAKAAKARQGAEISQKAEATALFNAGDQVQSIKDKTHKGKTGTVRSVTANDDGTYTYKVSWGNGVTSDHAETDLFEAAADRERAAKVVASANASPVKATDDVTPPPTTPPGAGTPADAAKPPPAAAGGKGITFAPVLEKDKKIEKAKDEKVLAGIQRQPGTYEAETPTGNVKVSGRLAIMEAEDLITSDKPGFPPEFQNRGTDAFKSENKARNIGKKLDTKKLGLDDHTDSGAPLITQLFHVLAGNHRVWGILYAIQHGLADDYFRWVRIMAEQEGIAIPGSVKHPVLVRVIDSAKNDAELKRISRLSNKEGDMEITSDAEKALTDAEEIIDGNMLPFFNPGANGDLLVQKNNDFMTRFMAANEGQGLRDVNGNPNKKCISRIKNALFAIIMNRGAVGKKLTLYLLNSPDTKIDKVVTAITNTATDLVRLDFNKPQLSIVNDLNAAIREYQTLLKDLEKQTPDGQPVWHSVNEWLNQGAFDFDADPRTEITAALIKELYYRQSTAEGIEALINDYVSRAMQDTDTGDAIKDAERKKELAAAPEADRPAIKAKHEAEDATARQFQREPLLEAAIAATAKYRGDVKPIAIPRRASKATPAPAPAKTAAKPEPVAPAPAPVDPTKPWTGVGQGDKAVPTPTKPPEAKWKFSIPLFQGGKRMMIDYVVPALKKLMGQQERDAIHTVWDGFGGSGGWGLTLALELFKNAKLLSIGEFDANRLAKIKFFHQRGDKMAEIVQDARFQAIVKSAMEKMKKQREIKKAQEAEANPTFSRETVQVSDTKSAGSLAKALETALDEAIKAGMDEQDIIGCVQAIADRAANGAINTADSKGEIYDEILAGAITDAANIRKAAQAFEARDGKIEYRDEKDTYKATIPAGPGVFVTADPPYNRTTGYSEDGKPEEVGVDIYRQTRDLVGKAAAQGNVILYTDSAWWIDKPYTTEDVDLAPVKKEIGLFGEQDEESKKKETAARKKLEDEQKRRDEERSILLDILNTLDHLDVVNGKIGNRHEVMGVQHGRATADATGRIADGEGQSQRGPVADVQQEADGRVPSNGQIRDVPDQALPGMAEGTPGQAPPIRSGDDQVAPPEGGEARLSVSAMPKGEGDFAVGPDFKKIDRTGMVDLYHVTLAENLPDIAKSGEISNRHNPGGGVQGFVSAVQGVYGWGSLPRAVAEVSRAVDEMDGEGRDQWAIIHYRVPATEDRLTGDEDVSEEAGWRESLESGNAAVAKGGVRFDEIDGIYTDNQDATVRQAVDQMVQRRDTTGKPRYSVTATDTAYMAAVRRDDMAEAQRIVDEEAKKAGYTIKAYHRTREKFTEFDRDYIGSMTPGLNPFPGFFFSSSKQYSHFGIGERPSFVGKRMDVYLKMKNPLHVTDYINDANLNKIVGDDSGERYDDKYLRRLIKAGYDGVILHDGRVLEYCIPFSEQIKSASPITMDDDGHIVPPSQRFNRETPDIRFSVSAAAYPIDQHPGTLKESDFIQQKLILDAEWSPYQDSGKSSRNTPIPDYEAKIGAWYIDPSTSDFGSSIDQMLLLNPATLEPGEHMVWRNEEGRGVDSDLYAKWLTEGKLPPPIRVLETEGGNLRVSDGHRRFAAALKEGRPVLALVSPMGPSPTGGREFYSKKLIGMTLTDKIARMQVEGKLPEWEGQPWAERVKPFLWHAQTDAGKPSLHASNATVTPPGTRHSVSAAPPRLGSDSYITAAAAAEILAGKEPDLATYDSLAKVLQTAQTGQQTIDRARKLAESSIAKAAKEALDSPDPMEAIMILGRQVEAEDYIKIARSGVRKGAKAYANLSEAGQKAKDSGRKALLASVRGEDLQSLVVDTGIDLVATIVEIDPERFAESPGQKDKAKTPGEGNDADEAMINALTGEVSVTPEQLADRARRMQNLLQMAKDWWSQERSKREKAAQERAERRAARAEAGEADDEQDDEDAAAEQAEDKMILTIPQALLDAAKVDFTNAREFAHFFRLWTADFILRKSRGRLTPETLWADPEAQEKYRKTTIQMLTQMANATVDPIDRALPTINRLIGELNGSMTPDQIERQSAAILKVINSNAIRQTRAKLVHEIDKEVANLTKDGKSFDATKADVKRKVTAEVEKIARKLPRIIRYTDRKKAAEVDRLTNLMAEREGAYEDSHNPDANVELDVQYHVASLELQMINRYGGLKYRMPADIAAAKREIVDDWLGPERERMIAKVTATIEQDKPFIEALTKAISRDPQEHGRPKKEGTLAAIADSMIATIRQRLQNIVRFAKGEARSDADAAIEHVMLLMGEGSETYVATLDSYRREHDRILEAVSDGDAKGYLKHLEDLIPADVAQAISKQGYHNGMTYGQAVQLYASITQASYADNVIRHGRQGQAAMLEGILTSQDIALVNALRRMYEARRAELSAIVEAVTGVPIWSPDPDYMPVRIERDPRAGLKTEGRAWHALADQLTPRVAHRRDFDEGADVLGMIKRSQEIAARAIAFGERGIHIRSILTSKDVKAATIRFHGPQAMSRLMDQVNDHLMGIDERAGGGTSRIVRAVGRLTSYTAISWNILSAAKQLGSIPTWGLVLDGGFKDMFAAIADFDRQAYAELVDSDGFRARYGAGMVVEMQEALAAGEGRGRMLARFYKLGMKPLQAADAIASLVAGVGVYKAKRAALIEQGVDPAQASRNAKTLTFNLIEECQQSARPENQPDILRRYGPVARMFVQFASAPALQLSHEVQAIRDVQAGVEGAKEKLARVILINHAIVPAIMLAMSSGFARLLGDEPDDEFWDKLIINMLIGPASRVLFLGAMTESAIRAMIHGRRDYYGQRMIPAENIVRWSEIGALTAHHLFTADWEKLQKDLLDMVSATGAPQRMAIKWWKNRQD